MPGLVAAVCLLLLNRGVIAAVLAFSPTPRRSQMMPAETDRCFVCSTTDLETTVNDYPVCGDCKNEYLRAVC